MKNITPEDKFVFPKGHELHEVIVYDSSESEYYNVRTDIFLSEDDIKYHKLRPYEHITSPLPDPLPENYFVEWDREKLKTALDEAMEFHYPKDETK